jgi:multidrug resistance efflux pump
MKRLLIGVFLLLLLAVCMLTALRGRTDAVLTPPEATATVPAVRASQQVLADGRIVPVRRSEMSFAMPGIVAEVLVAEGDHVEAGQVLARLEAAPQTAALQQAEANLARAQVASTPREVDVAQAALAQARAELQMTELRTPLAGTLVYLRLHPGQFVAPGEPIVRVADPAAWQIETTDLTELDIVRIQAGDPATIHVEALPDLELTGRVTHLGSYGEPWQGAITYTVIVTPDTQDARLRWNMTASLTIEPKG